MTEGQVSTVHTFQRKMIIKPLETITKKAQTLLKHIHQFTFHAKSLTKA